MTPYWVLFFIPALALLSSRKMSEHSTKIVWALVWVVFSLVIGLRHEIGADWFSYDNHLYLKSLASLSDVLIGGDPGYYLITWAVAQLGGTIHWVNLFCGMIVAAGVIRFSKNQPLPWLALLVSIPYLIIVVAMGYTRQSVALALVLVGLVALKKENLLWFALWVTLAATFHKSAVLMLPIAALSASRNRFWTLLWVGVVSLVAAYFFILDSVDQLVDVYLGGRYESSGALIRVFMNAVPAMLYILLIRSFRLSEAEKRLWFWMSLIAIACIPLVVISSTATDRVALYFIPIQLFVFSRLPFVLSDARKRALVVLSILGYYALVQVVWLNFASHADAWVPYEMVGFQFY